MQYWRSACRRVVSCVKHRPYIKLDRIIIPAWISVNEHCFHLSRDSFSAYRQFVFAAFTEEFISAPFTEPIFHFFIPALSDARLSFPFEAFLSSLQATISSSSVLHSQAPWVFYFVLSAGENRLGESYSSSVYAGVYLLYTCTSRSCLCPGRLVVRGRAPALPSGSADSSTSAASVGEQQPHRSRQRLRGRWQRHWYPVTSNAGQLHLNVTPQMSDWSQINKRSDLSGDLR